MLGRFRHRYPQLELKLETGDAALAVDKVLQEETDIAIAARPMLYLRVCNIACYSECRWCLLPRAIAPMSASG